MYAVFLAIRHSNVRKAIMDLMKGAGVRITDTYENSDFVISDNEIDVHDKEKPTIVMTPFPKKDRDGVYYIDQPFEISSLFNVINFILTNRSRLATA